MDWKVTTLIIAAIFAALYAFIGRYEVVAVPAGGEGVYGQIYRLDHWTGEVLAIEGKNSARVSIN